VDFIKRNKRLLILGLVTLVTFGLALGSFRENRGGLLTVAFLDIGQGDAIYIEAPNGVSMLVDGGPPGRLSTPLGAVMPFYDHTVDVLLVTNPDQDHMGGFIDVLRTYAVKTVIEPGTVSTTGTYKTFEEEIERQHIQKIIAKRGETFILSPGVYFDVLFPDRDVSGVVINDGSIVGRLRYGERSVLFTGDAPQKIEHFLSELNPQALKADILKVGHHGSRTSTSDELLDDVMPDVAVISAGLNNKYGHPNKEVTDRLEERHIPTLVTAHVGTIIFQTDGHTWWRK
jgi:competence protein ComEC